MHYCELLTLFISHYIFKRPVLCGKEDKVLTTVSVSAYLAFLQWMGRLASQICWLERKRECSAVVLSLIKSRTKNPAECGDKPVTLAF